MTATLGEGGSIEAVARAADRGDWSAATAAAERLIDLLVRAIGVRDDRLVRAIGDGAAGVGLAVTVDHDLPAAPDAATVAAVLRGIAAAAAVACRGAVRAEDGDTRTRIIEKLVLAGSRPMTNTDLAQACDRSEETISRVLKPLRREGLVLSRPAGRTKQNWITEPGRRLYEGDDGLHRCLVHMGKRDIVDTPHPWRDMVMIDHYHDQSEETVSVRALVKA